MIGLKTPPVPTRLQRPRRVAAVAARPTTGPLTTANLLNSFDQLVAWLVDAQASGDWLDAYLLAAGLNQLAEDYLHPDLYKLNRAATYLESTRFRSAGPLLRLASSALVWVRFYRPQIQRLRRWQHELARLVQHLAAVIVRPGPPVAGQAEALQRQTNALLGATNRLPAGLRRDILRLPSCYRSFDQQPADLARLVEKFARRYPDKQRPLLVVGVRTSGSYLAPLTAVYLRAAGFQNVQVLTTRPGCGWLPPERRLLRNFGRQNGLALLTDDPPTSGASLARSAAALAAAGLSTASIVLLLTLFETRPIVPPPLHRYSAVLLPWDEWSIQAKLTPLAVQSTLSRLFAPDRVVGLEPQSGWPTHPQRGHVRARFRVELAGPDGNYRTEQVYVIGVGLGYFGRTAIVTAKLMADWLPPVFGLESGLLYRAWLPEREQLTPTNSPRQLTARAEAIVAYVLASRQALATPQDASLRLAGQNPVWEVAARLLSRAFGRAWPLAQSLVVARGVRRLLRVDSPTVVDGAMSLDHWFHSAGAPRHLRKVNADERAFSHLDLSCYDPVYDLAGVAPEAGGGLAGLLRRAFERRSGQTISPERWLIYTLVHLWNLERLGQTGRQPGPVKRARAMQAYWAEHWFTGLSPATAGPLVALDLDGVLETETLGMASLSPASALTLFALHRHGYRPLLATGRSLAEVQDRCTAYGLPGGVAEYGAVVYHQASGLAQPLLTQTQQADLTRLRLALRRLDGVELDPAYTFACRAFGRNSAGQRRGLRPEQIRQALAEARVSDSVRAVPGQSQTDFVPAGIDKGRGLRVLARLLGVDASPLLALAVGDTVEDRPMLALAALALGPAQAAPLFKPTKIACTASPYQIGLAQAATQLLGHRPGNCPICHPPQLSPEAAWLHTLLAAQESGRWGMLRQAFRLRRLAL